MDRLHFLRTRRSVIAGVIAFVICGALAFYLAILGINKDIELAGREIYGAWPNPRDVDLDASPLRQAIMRAGANEETFTLGATGTVIERIHTLQFIKFGLTSALAGAIAVVVVAGLIVHRKRRSQPKRGSTYLRITPQDHGINRGHRPDGRPPMDMAA